MQKSYGLVPCPCSGNCRTGHASKHCDRNQKETRNEQIKAFITEVIAYPESIAEFRTDYFGHIVNKITIYPNRTVFTFSCDVEIEA